MFENCLIRINQGEPDNFKSIAVSSVQPGLEATDEIKEK